METKPECIVHLTCYVQSPTIDIEFFDPVLSNSYEVISSLGICHIELWHHSLITKAFIIRIIFRIIRANHREGKLIKPVFISGLLSIYDNILECKEVPSTVIEDTIDDDADTAGMVLLHQCLQVLIPSEDGIDMEVV